MRKLTILFALLTLSVGMWAIDGVKYLDANGVEQTANNVTEITNDASKHLIDGWYVVYGADVQTGTLVCQDNVHLILADGAKLTAMGSDDFLEDMSAPGIQVSGSGNSLTIYGQANQVGQLIANGGYGSAGIGGKQGMHHPTNITINGGIVIAKGTVGGAGIGGGSGGDGSHITINGGFVTATGGNIASGIGGGDNGSSSDIYVATNLVVKADQNNPPTTVIENDGTDLASKLTLRPYVTVDPGSLDNVKANAIAAINAAIEGITDGYIISIASKAISDIEAAGTIQSVFSIKATVLAEIKAKLLSYARIDAMAAINAAATAAKEDIDAASSYEAAKATQNQYKESIDAVVSGAIYNINNATSEEAVAEEVLQAKTDINQLKSEALATIAKINESEELQKYKVFAIMEIDAASQGIQHVEFNNWIRAALVEIPDVTTKDEVDRIKGEVLSAISFYKDGKAEGKAELVGEMGEPCTDCTAVEVTDGTTTVTLYAPTGVDYIKK